MNGGAYADAVYSAAAVPGGFTFTSPDGKIVKTIAVADGSHDMVASYVETVDGPLYVRLGLSPNPLDLAFHGHAHLESSLDAGAGRYVLRNTAGGGAVVDFGTATWNPAPADAGWDRRNLGLTEQVEISAEGSFTVTLTLVPGVGSVTGVLDPTLPGGWVRGPYPSPSPAAGRAWMSVWLEGAGSLACEILDVRGRRVRAMDLGVRGPGEARFELPDRAIDGAALPAGIYLVRVRAGDATAVRKWVRVR
jgi:hypothetical protein